MSRKLEQMYGELCCHQLITVLAPSKRGLNDWDCIRVNVDVPPRWYRIMCNENASKRGVRHGRFDTIVKRQHTLRALERMIAGNLKGRYAERILEISKTFKL